MKILFLFFLFTTSAFADPSEARIQEIGARANTLERESLFKSIEFTSDLTLPNPAAAFFLGNSQFRISINRSIFDTLSKEAQNLIGFHELGHIYLGHTEMDPRLKNRYEIELEADVFAAFLYKRFGQKNREFENFINFIEKQKETTPPGNVRAKIFRKIIFSD